MQKNKVEISKVTLKVGGKDIELTLEQARELKNVLVELFSDGVPWTTPVLPIQPIYPIAVPSCPQPPWDVWHDKTTCFIGAR